MSTPPTSRSNRLRDILGAAAVAVGVCISVTAEARPEPKPAAVAPLEARLREANESMRRLAPPADATDLPQSATRDDKPGVHWGNYWANFNPWRNWNNWNNWHNFNQWANL